MNVISLPSTVVHNDQIRQKIFFAMTDPPITRSTGQQQPRLLFYKYLKKSNCILVNGLAIYNNINRRRVPPDPTENRKVEQPAPRRRPRRLHGTLPGRRRRFVWQTPPPPFLVMNADRLGYRGKCDRTVIRQEPVCIQGDSRTGDNLLHARTGGVRTQSVYLKHGNRIEFSIFSTQKYQNKNTELFLAMRP